MSIVDTPLEMIKSCVGSFKDRGVLHHALRNTNRTNPSILVLGRSDDQSQPICSTSTESAGGSIGGEGHDMFLCRAGESIGGEGCNMLLSQWTDNGLNSRCCTLKGAWVCLMCYCYSPVTNYILSAVGPHPLNITLWDWVLHAAASFVLIAGRWEGFLVALQPHLSGEQCRCPGAL